MAEKEPETTALYQDRQYMHKKPTTLDEAKNYLKFARQQVTRLTNKLHEGPDEKLIATVEKQGQRIADLCNDVNHKDDMIAELAKRNDESYKLYNTRLANLTKVQAELETTLKKKDGLEQSLKYANSRADLLQAERNAYLEVIKVLAGRA